MLRLYNSLTRKKQIFKPLKTNQVKIYSCGPTVYDYAHLGNFRSYIAWDLLKRFLAYSGYKTKVVKNITDVGHFTDEDEDRGEDKLDKAAKKEKKGPLEIARFYTKAFIQEEKKLNILAPDYRPRATQEIKMIQKIIKSLVKSGHAYDAKDGVYFNIAKFPRYGRLSGNTFQKILAGARVEINPYKKHPADFALWIKKVEKNRLHSLHWPSPWGDGFPGWHIECSAMAIRYLGNSIDIHTGGKDNKFPHHESEIAQSETYTGKPFSRFWLHTDHMDVNGKKMSKSLKNFYTLQNIIDAGFDPLAYRFWTLTAHYRSPMNFTWKGLREASNNWSKIVEFYTNGLVQVTCLPARQGDLNQKILATSGSSHLPAGEAGRLEPTSDNENYIIKKEDQFIAALSDDLNTPKAIALLLQIVKNANRDPKKIPATNYLIKKWDKVLGILPKKIPGKGKMAVPADIEKLLADRQKARKNKDFKKADTLRQQIEKLGFELIDLPNGKSKLKKRL